MKYRLTFILFAAAIIYGCSQSKYAVTNKSYKEQAKVLAKTLAQYPVKDSVIYTTEWVGTTNFNLRKPNFIIIHHTAQNSCEQTLTTFTTVKSQVSAHYVICTC